MKRRLTFKMEENEKDEVDVLEFELDRDGIEELMGKLNELMETKGHIGFSIDEDNDLLIHYSENEEEEE